MALGGGVCGCDEVSDSKPETFGCDSGGGCGDALRVVISVERGKGGRRWQVVCLMVVIFVVVGQVQIVFLSVWRMLLLIEWLRPAAPQGPLQVQSEVLLGGPHLLLGL